MYKLLTIVFFSSISVLTLFGNQAHAQPSNKAHPFLLYDINGDLVIDNDDINEFQLMVRNAQIPFGRGLSHPVDATNQQFDIDFSGWIDMGDVFAILLHFGHFNSSGTEFISGGNCQMGDLNADGAVDDDDMTAFVDGRRYWQWWNLPGQLWAPKQAIYTMGDINMDGFINQLDLDLMEILWSSGVPFNYTLEDDYTDPNAPNRPIGWFTWFCG